MKRLTPGQMRWRPVWIPITPNTLPDPSLKHVIVWHSVDKAPYGTLAAMVEIAKLDFTHWTVWPEGPEE